MEQRYARTRRGFVAGVAAVLSGCIGGGSGGGDEDCEGAPVEEGAGGDGEEGDNTTDDAGAEATDNTTDGTQTDDGGTEGSETEAGTTDEDLDLREANVVAVTFSEQGEEGTHSFDVTLYHDDDGEDGYADWWQVESLDGDCLGRRVLTHAHGTQRFTRSETVETGDRSCVVVRGHDQTHGYGGRAVVLDLETAETNGYLQGEEPSSFDESDCP